MDWSWQCLCNSLVWQYLTCVSHSLSVVCVCLTCVTVCHLLSSVFVHLTSDQGTSQEPTWLPCLASKVLLCPTVMHRSSKCCHLKRNEQPFWCGFDSWQSVWQSKKDMVQCTTNEGLHVCAANCSHVTITCLAYCLSSSQTYVCINSLFGRSGLCCEFSVCFLKGTCTVCVVSYWLAAVCVQGVICVAGGTVCTLNMTLGIWFNCPVV